MVLLLRMCFGLAALALGIFMATKTMAMFAYMGTGVPDSTGTTRPQLMVTGWAMFAMAYGGYRWMRAIGRRSASAPSAPEQPPGSPSA